MTVALAVCFAATAQTPPNSPTFLSGTRLVEVEVIVRSNSGPVTGLTKDDFILLDQGRPQRIAEFRGAAPLAPAAAQAPSVEPSKPLPPGAVSNRTDSAGRPINGATVVLFDQLNVQLDLKGYQRVQIAKLLRSLTATDRIALYSLGRDLHVVQDFTDDPEKLVAGIAKLDQGLDLMPIVMGDDKTGALMDLPDPSKINTGDPITDGMARKAIMETAAGQVQIDSDIYGQITIQAIQRIVQHLSGVAGRKNLVWLKESPQLPPQAMAMLLAANISLYPVLVRSLGDSGVLSQGFARGRMSEPVEFVLQRAVRDIASATGGAGFTDAADLKMAVRTAEEDSAHSYVLGYYPPDEMLDGRFHRLTVKLSNETQRSEKPRSEPGEKPPQLRYRPGYLATRSAPVAPAETAQQVIDDPLDSTGIGLTAQVQPDGSNAALRQVLLTIDLHGVHLDLKDGRLSGALDLYILPAGAPAVNAPVRIEGSQAQLQKVLETGDRLVIHGLNPKAGDLRLVVRDRATGLSGSLHVPVAKQ